MRKTKALGPYEFLLVSPMDVKRIRSAFEPIGTQSSQPLIRDSGDSSMT